MSEKKKFGLLRGLSDIFICEISDTVAEYKEIGTPEQLIPAGEMTVSKSIEKQQFYFDNSMWDEVGQEAPSEMSVIGAAVRAAFLAWIEGKDVDAATGAILDDGDWHSKFFAISGTKNYTDGTSEHFWFLKASFGGAEEAAKTKDASTDAKGMTLPFTAFPTLHKFKDGKHRKVIRIDTANTKLLADQSWTAQVVTPDNLATVCEKVTEAAAE